MAVFFQCEMMRCAQISEKTMNAPLAQNQPAQLRRPEIVAGIAISLVLHLLLIFGYRLSLPVAPEQPPARTMTVWLQPPKPIVARIATPAKPEPKEEPARKRKRDLERPALAARPSTPAPALATSQAITLPAPSNPVADPLHPEEQPKKFDMNAALKTARKVANEKDPARAGLPVAQLDDHPLYPEQRDTQLARDIAGAKRGDCKNTGAGLLSPLIWLMDKKDSGCKF
jgi:hypothetical protein